MSGRIARRFHLTGCVVSLILGIVWDTTFGTLVFESRKSPQVSHLFLKLLDELEDSNSALKSRLLQEVTEVAYFPYLACLERVSKSCSF